MRKRSPTKNKWILIDDVHYDYTHREEDHIYKPWQASAGLNSTKRRRGLLKLRPEITGHKRSSRLMKDMVYKTWVNEHIVPSAIRGPYIGLAAAYTPEIFAAFFPYITEKFVNCQIHKKDYRELADYQPHIYDAYDPTVYGVNFYLYREDICKRMLADNNFTYSHFDLDFMWSLSPYRVKLICAGLAKSAKPRSTVAVWHSTNRKYGEEYVDYARKHLRQELAKDFDIVKDTRINYYEGYPMRTDIFTLDRKAA